MNRRQRLFETMEKAWNEFRESYAGLSEPELLAAGVSGSWSVRDIIAHITTWEEETLHHLPAILQGKRPPKYSVLYGGIDAFNAKMTAARKDLPLSEVLRQQEHVHGRLINLINGIREDLLENGTSLRKRIRLDTYGHYRKHAAAIREWRIRQGWSRSLPGN